MIEGAVEEKNDMVRETGIEGLSIEVTHHRDAVEGTGQGQEIERDPGEEGLMTGVEGHREIDSKGLQETLDNLQSQGKNIIDARGLTQKTKVNQSIGQSLSQSLGKNHQKKTNLKVYQKNGKIPGANHMKNKLIREIKVSLNAQIQGQEIPVEKN
jgi:hypothetical protein